mgnify:CR=1 FL=1
MACAEDVERTLGAAQEAARSVTALHARKRLAPAGERLVSVGLMPDVPDHAVVGRLEDGVQRDGQLDHAETTREVSAPGGAERDQLVAQLLRDASELFSREAAQCAGLSDPVQQRLQQAQRRTPSSRQDDRGGRREAKCFADSKASIGQ